MGDYGRSAAFVDEKLIFVYNGLARSHIFCPDGRRWKTRLPRGGQKKWDNFWGDRRAQHPTFSCHPRDSLPVQCGQNINTKGP